MHKLESLLILVSPNLATKDDPRFLLIDENGTLQLPNRQVMESETCLEVAAELLFEHTSLRARINNVGWVVLEQGKLADDVSRVKMTSSVLDERFIGVPFGGMVPSDQVDLNDHRARWVPLSEVFHRKEEFVMDHYHILRSTSIFI